ncbi:hypothetical protein Q3H58_001960 [Pseudomonas psychrotolerans]|nr:hypothetical protein [Pseudomonas psychrotolerans]
MPQLIARHNPKAFKTLPLLVEASAEGLTYQALGQPLNFAEMLQRRQPIELADAQHFSVKLANLGVSVRLTLNWQGQDHWLLVRQRRPDRGDVVLKLISGYIPAHELALPLLTAVQEVAEECLIETPRGWLGGRFADTWLPTPYAPALSYREDVAFRLTPRSGAARPVRCGSLALLERPRAYVHTPTASLQLVYDLLLELPKECKAPSLFHVDEKIETTVSCWRGWTGSAPISIWSPWITASLPASSIPYRLDNGCRSRPGAFGCRKASPARTAGWSTTAGHAGATGWSAWRRRTPCSEPSHRRRGARR